MEQTFYRDFPLLLMDVVQIIFDGLLYVHTHGSAVVCVYVCYQHVSRDVEIN